MLLEDRIKEILGNVDERDRRSGRAALRGMVSSGQIQRSDLGRVVAPGRARRINVANLTVSDLIQMGIVVVIDD